MQSLGEEVVWMSRRNYREIADAIRELKDSPVPMNWEMIARKLAAALKKDNPRFSVQKFWEYLER